MNEEESYMDEGPDANEGKLHPNNRGPQEASVEPSVPAAPLVRATTEGSGGGGRPKRASILKKPGHTPDPAARPKRASINLGDIERLGDATSAGGGRVIRGGATLSASTATTAPPGRTNSVGNAPTTTRMSTGSAVAATVDSRTINEEDGRRKRRTMDLGSLFKSRSAKSEAFSGQEKQRHSSISMGFFRARSSQHNDSAGNWSEVETESLPGRMPHRRSRSNNSVASGAGSTGLSLDAPTDLISWCCWRCIPCSCPGPPPAAKDWINDRLINTKTWYILTILFTIVLLFGTQIQYLWCPPESDLAFDVIFTCAFVFLMFDVILRSAADRFYFVFSLCGHDLRLHNGESSPQHFDSLCGLRSFFQIGSFMFWCDLLSTVSLLWDISYISIFRTKMYTFIININELGMPKQGLFVNDGVPVQVEDALVLEIIIAIFRTLRVSRFIKTSAVVKTSSKVNWYWLPDRLDPSFWLSKCRGKTNQDKSLAGGILSEMSDSAPLEISNSLMRSSSVRSFRRRRSSFSEFGDKYGDSGGGRMGDVVNSLIHKFGTHKRRVREFERQTAATKIQRVWREHCEVTGKRSNRRENGAKLKSKPSTLENAKNFVMRRRTSTSSIPPMDAEAMKESQVGSAMRELTGQRVAIGIVIALVLTVLFSYSEANSTPLSTMLVLHDQTQNAEYRDDAIDAARNTTIPNLFWYNDTNGPTNGTYYELNDGVDPDRLRPREKMMITVMDEQNVTSSGLFDVRQSQYDGALVELIDTIFILLIWFFGVTAFAGPVMVLVVTPIERMIRLLSMLVKDPLGYQGSSRYKKFVAEENRYTENTKWSKDVLKGMETSFLMSTILRIGSLMKVGFGAAGVEIIRNNLEKSESKDGRSLVLNTQGTTVQCIFLFCDIRQFTDATESLQEEVFVFTNKIASVVHSICNAYGGSANKNVGDAFLMSWLLEDETSSRRRGSATRLTRGQNRLTRSQIKADSAVLAVVKICIALYYDKFFLEDMTDVKRNRLMKKISKRMGPVVQMGLGLHCGKAVQGAIGTQRKLDATYVSDAVEFAEFLESSTKSYGVKMLMSNHFHDLLSPQAARRCRKIDQLLIIEDDMDPDDPDLVEIAEKVELFTFDMDIDELWKHRARTRAHAIRFGAMDGGTNHSVQDDFASSLRPGVAPSGKSKRDLLGKLGAPAALTTGNTKHSDESPPPRQMGRRRTSLLLGRPKQAAANSMTNSDGAFGRKAFDFDYEINERGVPIHMPELKLPSGTIRYTSSSWNTEEMRVIRKKFSDGFPFFIQFNTALKAYYSGDWKTAGEMFSAILERFEDGPSRYFMRQIEAHGGTPPRKFLGYNVVNGR